MLKPKLEVTAQAVRAWSKGKPLYVVVLPATDKSSVSAYGIGVKLSQYQCHFLTKKAAEKCLKEELDAMPDMQRFYVRQDDKPTLFVYSGAEIGKLI